MLWVVGDHGGPWLKRAGLNRLACLEPAPPIRRYEHASPGDLLHLDIKKVGRFRRPGHRVLGPGHGKSYGAGWEYVHVAIDDHSRVAFAQLEPDETARRACHALLAALRYYRGLGVRFTRVLTDNGPCYQSRAFRRSHVAWACGTSARPYTPRTNG